MCAPCIIATQKEWTLHGSRLYDQSPGDGVSWVETWRNGDKGAKGGERTIEGGVRRSGQASQSVAAHRELSIAGVPTQLPTLFILSMNINEGLLKYSHSSPACSSHQAEVSARIGCTRMSLFCHRPVLSWLWKISLLPTAHHSAFTQNYICALCVCV